MVKTNKSDYLFRGELVEVDPDVAEIVRHETARQAKYLIMIASESTVPEAVRETLSSAFHNVYAEGYPLESTRTLTQNEILDYNARLPEFRRLSDERYYKGTEYADIIEALARRRTAEVFAANGYSADQLFVNVQPLSGAPANNAVYTALLDPGDTVMGMDLIDGGHLTHGSPVNRSGRFYNIVSYGVNPATGNIDYARMMELAQEHKPRMIIGGFSSFPHVADWAQYRKVADSVGAYLLADIAHFAGLVAAGVYPSPIGIADVVTFTTHKTMGGPRGAMIITHQKKLAAKIDRGVFPGEQGGPHINTIAGMAVAMKLATTGTFKKLQKQTLVNASGLATQLAERGLRIAYNGTETHLLCVDCKSVTGKDGTPLSGDMAARILDLAGIVVNRQTIPGDTSALRPSGIRLGTPWITQRGFGAREVDQLADIIADLLLAIEPFSYPGRKRPLARAKIDFETLHDVRNRARDLAASVGIDTEVVADGYPHFDYLAKPDDREGWQTLKICGANAAAFLDIALTSDLLAIRQGSRQHTCVLSPNGEEIAQGIVEVAGNNEYLLHVNQKAHYVGTWFRSLSDGFVQFDSQDPYARIPGPVYVQYIGPTEARKLTESGGYAKNKSYFVGINGDRYSGPRNSPQPLFEWEEPEGTELLTTPLTGLHRKMGAKMVPFAGYDMPVWYSSVTEEHLATRNRAGLFDVSHMGVLDFRGPGAARFLDNVTTNDVTSLPVGISHYTYLLDIHGIPVDDLMIYRLGEEHFMAVVNASNNDKNWAWLKAVKNREVMIDPDDPGRVAGGAESCIMRDLRDPSAGSDMRVDIALQGPMARDLLLAMDGLEEDKQAVSQLPWAGVTRAHLGGLDLIISRTGYTGERIAYELFIRPDRAMGLFEKLVELGATPCGLASRDSLRTEAGLPLYGHELAGPLNMNPADAGFRTYVKLWKPFFIGKSAFIAHELKRSAEVVRFRLDVKGARPPHQGDPLVDKKGRVVGIVTSCSIDSEGFQLGQAYLNNEYTKPGTSLGVFAGSERTKPVTFSNLTVGKKLSVPDGVTVLDRFPKSKR